MDLSALWGKGSNFLKLQGLPNELAVEKDGTSYLETHAIICYLC